jgi:hypothetical protein
MPDNEEIIDPVEGLGSGAEPITDEEQPDTTVPAEQEPAGDPPPEETPPAGLTKKQLKAWKAAHSAPAPAPEPEPPAEAAEQVPPETEPEPQPTEEPTPQGDEGTTEPVADEEQPDPTVTEDGAPTDEPPQGDEPPPPPLPEPEPPAPEAPPPPPPEAERGPVPAEVISTEKLMADLKLSDRLTVTMRGVDGKGGTSSRLVEELIFIQLTNPAAEIRVATLYQRPFLRLLKITPGITKVPVISTTQRIQAVRKFSVANKISIVG